MMAVEEDIARYGPPMAVGEDVGLYGPPNHEWIATVVPNVRLKHLALFFAKRRNQRTKLVIDLKLWKLEPGQNVGDLPRVGLGRVHPRMMPGGRMMHN